MKAETVADGDGSGDTLALTGRERAAALAGRERADTDGREPAGAEAGPDTGSEGERTATGGDRKPAASTAGPDEDTAAARKPRDAPGSDTASGKDRTPRAEPGSTRTDALGGHAPGEPRPADAAQDPRAARSGTPGDPEATDSAPGETSTRPGPAGTSTRGRADREAPAADRARTHTRAEADGPTRADTRDPETPAGSEPGDADASAGAHTAAETGPRDGGAPRAPEPAGADPAGAPSPAEGDADRADAPGRDVADGRAPAEDGLRRTQDGTSRQETPDEPEPAGADATGADASDAAPAPRTARAGGPGNATAGAGAAAEDDSATVRPDAHGGKSPAEDGRRGTDPGDAPGPRRAGRADAGQPDAPTSPAAGAGAAPARRPSWAQRDDRPEAGGTPARIAADPRTSPWGRPADGDAAQNRSGEGGSTAATGTAGTKPAAAGGDAAERRPSWAKSGDEPQGEDAATAAEQAPDDAGPSGAPASGEEPEEDGTDAGSGDQPTAEVPLPAATAGADAPAASGRPGAGTGGRKPTADATRARREPKGAAKTTRAATAAAPPHDPERTSEFVALKDPDAVGPKPTPAPARTPAPPVLEPTRESPRPPLDLLAELTNTAPPPETPRRTLTRRAKVWTPIVLLLGAAVAGGQMLRPLPAPQLVVAQDSLTLDGTLSIPWPAKGQGAVRIMGSGDVATFGEQKPTPTASVAKAMTAYVILKNHPLRKDEQGPQIEIDAQAAAESASEDESRIRYLKAGQNFSQREMLEMVMLPSANNIARLLARWDGGSGGEAAFVAKMNAAARELGMRDTTYTDPSGLNATTVSTAVDQLKLAEAAMQDEMFRTVVATKTKTIKGVVEQLENSNKLLGDKSLGNKGIKTGSSTAAGGTLVWAADKQIGDETPLILGALMEQRVDGPDPQALRSLDLVLDNTRTINAAVRKALAATPVIHKGQTVGHVSDGFGGRTPLVATKDLSVIGVPGQRLRLALGTAGGKPVPHEAKAGAEVGVLTVGDGPGAKTVPVAVGAKLTEPSFGTRVTRLS